VFNRPQNFLQEEIAMSEESNSSRRQFFKTAAAFGGLALLMPALVQGAEERRRAAPAAGAGGAAPGAAAGAGAGGNADLNLPLVKPGEGMAASLHYQHNHKDIKDKSLMVERQGVPFDKQHCAVCMLYTPVGKKNGEDVGKCALFAGQLVKATGWCTSFSKKA
jgi:hypothetical protein